MWERRNPNSPFSKKVDFEICERISFIKKYTVQIRETYSSVGYKSSPGSRKNSYSR
ncbi:Uncharacterized protein APZ42_006962 [Daphnia magna]|uniref:Uncharacterized protein n=1 Tax=Daphnia magna TaxID=35525 RepID=A0A164FLI9_9CRUS|nr:Uncharacterized protein APZ42_006962 [Daphnia magna]